MSPETAQVPEPTPAGMGEFSRITGVFFEPGKAFADIGQRPRWFIPLLLVIVAGVAFYVTYGQHVGWERWQQHVLETNAQAQQRMAQVPADQRERTIAMQARVTGIAYPVGVAVMTPVACLITAAILLGLVSGIMSAGLKYKQVFAVVCYAALPVVIKHLLSIVVVFLKNPDDFNLMNPLAFNVAAFMDPLNSSKFLYTVAAAVDLFVIWGILLTATGLKASAGKRLSYGGALFAALVPTALFVLFGATIASMFS